MESHRSLLELGLLCQAALGSDLSASQEDEDLGDLSREAAALRARLRAVLRYSQESKKEGDKEGIYWLEKQKKKCQAIRKSVNSRAKALDPHKSLDETHKEKLKQNRQNMRERTKEYRKELEEMQLRVKNRPYLFEQVSKVAQASE